ncbi:spore germination protein [Paenibacillus sp. XY044]|uniref:spore germination protein n=1 Tax=Paenibacillus sp. XY044 TaxID=2026089 RepID=UPI000B993E07|nr:spore germination protein [Paenibacillus sp. XY044]OZB94936.1 spore germination protein [Paenibacillus sp. XY044]
METEQLRYIRSKLHLIEDMVYQPFTVHGCSILLLYIRSIVDKRILREQIVIPLLRTGPSESEDVPFLERIENGSLFAMPFQEERDPEKIVDAIVAGSAVLYISGLSYFCNFAIDDYTKRAVSDSTNEVVLYGPQVAFIEHIDDNLSLLRHKIKHPDLKTEQLTIGHYTKTNVCVTYIEGICKEEVLDEVKKKLSEIDIDSTLGITYLTEFIEPHPFAVFPQFQYTERPDTVAAALLEGRVAVLQDGTPYAMIVPVTYFSLLQSAEDYYQRFYTASFTRLIRLIFVFVAFMLPSLYVAITTFHPEIIPTNLLITIAAARENIPFPALVEALMMELFFEGLREAGIRIPRPLGQTVSIIGAIVIGQAAVQAGIVSAPMVIVVSITGIASFIIPHYELGHSFRLLRFAVLLLGGTLGMLGIVIAVYLIYLQLVSIKSYGVPYLRPFAPTNFSEMKDAFLRVPRFLQKQRPSSFAGNNRKRGNSR